MIYRITGYQDEGQSILYAKHCATIVEKLQKIKGINEITLTTSRMTGSVNMRSILGLMSVPAVRGDAIEILIDGDALAASEVATIVKHAKLMSEGTLSKVL